MRKLDRRTRTAALVCILWFLWVPILLTLGVLL
jgi:hypothetical protein